MTGRGLGLTCAIAAGVLAAVGLWWRPRRRWRPPARERVDGPLPVVAFRPRMWRPERRGLLDDLDVDGKGNA